MYIVARHEISDPDKFWKIARGDPPPSEFTLRSTLPSPDGKDAVCLWEAGSVQSLQQFLDSSVGGSGWRSESWRDHDCPARQRARTVGP